MAGKTNVDDYYSNVGWDGKSNSWNDNKKKIIVRKKVILKKVEIKKTVEKKDDTDSGKEITLNDTLDSKKKSTMSVVRRNEPRIWGYKKLEPKKQWDKKYISRPRFNSNSNSNWNKDFQKKTENTLQKKTENTGNKKEWEKKSFNSPMSKYSASDNKPKQKFKAWGWNRKTYDDNRRSRLSPYDARKTRGRVGYVNEDTGFIRSNTINKKKKEEKNVEDIKQNLVDRKWETIIVPDILNLKELSEKLWVSFPSLIAEFMKNWLMVNINSKIDFETASIVSEAFDIKLKRDDSKWFNVEDILAWDISKLLIEDDMSKLVKRPPVISIMWHVDHGKTSLLDYIRESKITSWEAGWITQSIWAYQVEKNWDKITFLDTPGHEAFTIMRARWAKSTDIAILVVAADEWVKPQTIESINHAKEAWIPVIVAINKMDKEWANPDHVKGQLSEHGLTPEDWGWDTPMVPVSAITGFWIDDLLEIILLVAEMQELKANPDRLAIATVIESNLDTKLWPVATVLINSWTMKIWENIVCNGISWKIKVLKNYNWKNIRVANIWDPVLIVWLTSVVEWGDLMQVVTSSVVAREKAIEYNEILKRKEKINATWLEMLMFKIKSWNLKQLKVVVKADTNWSLEAIKWAITKLSTPETTASIIHSWVWSITEGDIVMCEWSEAILVWFNVNILSTAKNILGSAKIEFINSSIIYHITEKIEKIITWMFDPKEVDVELCRAQVWWVFYTSKEFMVIGLRIKEDEQIENKTLVRVFRKDKFIWKWKIDSLKQWIEEVNKLEWPTECWIKFVWNVKIEDNDIIEVYKIEKQK